MNESENARRRILYDKFSNEERDCHRASGGIGGSIAKTTGLKIDLRWS